MDIVLVVKIMYALTNLTGGPFYYYFLMKKEEKKKNPRKPWLTKTSQDVAKVREGEVAVLPLAR